MSEWVSVFAVFWALWAVDGARLAPYRLFTVRGGGWRSVIAYGRLSLPGGWPGSWRLATPDVPLVLSPAGVGNAPAGGSGRPAERPVEARALRWAEVREVGVAKGWIFVNGAAFCPDTGHVSAPRLLELVRMDPAMREQAIRATMDRWFRPALLRRRVRVLQARTAWPARLNVLSLVVLAVLCAYVVADLASRLPETWSAGLVVALPGVLLGLLLAHLAAVVLTWRALRRLPPVLPEKRRSTLLSALLLPPQALRLRAVAGEGYFPAQHPLAVAVAFGNAAVRAEYAFQALSDMRWPLGESARSPLEAEIGGWFRRELEARLVRLCTASDVGLEALFVAPLPDAPASCNYCPRCRDQFVAGPSECPHGIPLRPLRRG